MAIDFNDVMINPDEGPSIILTSGIPGTTPSFSIGNVETVGSSAAAEVTVGGTVTNPILNFKIPRGVAGFEAINDNAGVGDTDYVWSADKVQRSLEMLAPLFDSSESYNPGDFVMNNDVLYRFTQAHSGSWNANHVEETSFSDAANFYLMHGYPQMITTAARLSALTGGTYSCDDFPVNSVVLISASNTDLGIVNCPTTVTTKEIITFYQGTKSGNSGRAQLCIDANNIYYRLRTTSWNSWKNIGTIDDTAGSGATAKVWSADKTKSEIDNLADNCIQSASVMITTTAGLEAITDGSKSLDDFPVNTIQMIGSTGIGLLDYPEGFTQVGTVMTYSYTSTATLGITQTYTDKFGRYAVRYRYNSSTDWSGWNKLSDTVYLRFDFANGASTQTTFPLEAGKKYYFKTNVPSDIFNPRYFLVYVDGYSDETSETFDFWKAYTPTHSGNLRMANLTAYDQEVILEVREATPENEILCNAPKKYYVDVTGTNSSTTSLTDLLLSFVKRCTNDSLATGMHFDDSPKEIYLYPGTYDIFGEYMAEIAKGDDSRIFGLDHFPADIPTGVGGKYSVYVPPNTKIIGYGNVTLQFTPTTSQINLGASLTWSPINPKGSFQLENVRIVAKNCRYGIHDDAGAAAQYATHIYRNVVIDYTEGDMVDGSRFGRSNTIGFGFSQKSTYTFENCELIYRGNNAHGVFYGHDGGAEGATLNITNCIIRSTNENEKKALRLQTLNSTSQSPEHYTVRVSNCVIQDGIYYDYDFDHVNAFEVTLIRSGDPPLRYQSGVDPSTNPYPPTIYE